MGYKKTTFSKYICWSITSFMLSLAVFSLNFVYAADIPIESYVTGGLTLVLNGDWETGLVHEDVKQVPGHFVDTTTYWEGVPSQDFIAFADDTSITGFYITIDQTDFEYTGSQSQTALPASYFKIYGKYAGGTPQSITKGYDDSSYNLSILPDSCGTATTDKFNFHSNFTSAANEYSILGSNSPQTLIESTADCLAIANIRFDRTEFYVPLTAAIGTYTSNITLTMYDGSPP